MDKYEEVMYNYCPQLQLWDALDWLKGNSIDYVEIPDHLEPHSSTSKTYEEILLSGPTPEASSPDTQSL